jgi:SAM-dependent methyltransferase
VITGYWISQVCGATARLGLADHLAGSSATIPELAQATSADPDGLSRLLRAGATIGLFAETVRDRFSVIPLGAELTSGQASGSLRDIAIALTAPGHWLPWGLLPEAVACGQPQDTAALGTDVWAYYAAHPEEGAHFARAMGSISAEASAAVLACWDATRFRRIVDVGGSQGILLAGLLDAAPSATGVLFDRPEVADGARTSLARLAGRVDVIGGDFLDEVPPGGDLYVLKSVLHDWDDQRALQILRNVHRAARPRHHPGRHRGPAALAARPVLDAPDEPAHAGRTERPGTHHRGVRQPAQPSRVPPGADGPHQRGGMGIPLDRPRSRPPMSSPAEPRSGQPRPEHRRRHGPAAVTTPGPGLSPIAPAPGPPSGAATAPGDHRYLFEHAHDGELARLQAIEAVSDPWTTDILQRAGPLAGRRCLDAGAGAGSIARWLAQRAGPRGLVVAADADTRFLQPPAPGLRVVRHDIRRGPLAPGGFALVHARFLLEWLPGRWRWTTWSRR